MTTLELALAFFVLAASAGWIANGLRLSSTREKLREARQRLRGYMAEDYPPVAVPDVPDVDPEPGYRSAATSVMPRVFCRGCRFLYVEIAADVCLARKTGELSPITGIGTRYERAVVANARYDCILREEGSPPDFVPSVRVMPEKNGSR